MIQEYISQIQRILSQMKKEEMDKWQFAAEKVAESLEQDGIIHLFGCGHSHMLAEEVFYRAGGLVPIHPILEEGLMLHEGPVRSSRLEKTEGYASTFMQNQDIRENDLFFVISTSGRNPVPIDAAFIAKEKGAYVIGITSLNYAQSQLPRHHSGQRLHEVVDLTLNNFSVKGDAMMTHPHVEVPFGSSSTIMGSIILNSIFIQGIAIMADKGLDIPIFLSGNLDGAEKHNFKLIEKYKHRIPLLAKV